MYMNNRAAEAFTVGHTRRRLLVGTGGDRPGSEVHERLQHARRHLQASRQPAGGGARACVRARARAEKHARHVQPGPGAERSRSRRRGQGAVQQAGASGPQSGLQLLHGGAWSPCARGTIRRRRICSPRKSQRAPYYHEFHFWLAAAYIGLGDTERARGELALAMETSTTRNDRDLYAAKLDRIKALSVHDSRLGPAVGGVGAGGQGWR